MHQPLQATNKASVTSSALVKNPAVQATNDPTLTRKETRRIVTPYAFFVADDLLGTPLAGPFRRGFGLLIDLFFILMLTQLSSLVLATVAAFTFFRAGNRLKTKKRFNGVRIALRLGVAVLLFTIVMGMIDSFQELNDSTDYTLDNKAMKDDPIDGIGVMALTAGYVLQTKSLKEEIANDECKPAYDCLNSLGQEMINDVVEAGLEEETIDSFMQTYLASVSENLTPDELASLTAELQENLQDKKIDSIDEQQPAIDHVMPEETNVESSHQSTSFIDWMENIAEEFGLGLGWAAFYFSIFTAWWKGQTPGKKLLGMKVIKLDNKPLNLWESFGRYGGYAAGLATGLMGFLQVFWDPNRQAIQDKISETLVINIRKPKVPFNRDVVSESDGQ